MLPPKSLDIEITTPPLKSDTPIEYQNVLIQEVREIIPHSNPAVERLEVVVVGGWRCLSQKGKYTVGDKVLFIPPDAILPEAYAESIGVANYLDKGSRVKTIKLRGEVSMGIITAVPAVYAAKPVGTDLGEALGITKWKPTLGENRNTSQSKTGKPAKHADTAYRPPMCWLYPDTANLRHYPNNIPTGEAVVVTEKCHGSNFCIAKCFNDRTGVAEYIVCSRSHPRKYPVKYVEMDFWDHPGDYITAAIKNLWEHRRWVKPRMAVPDPAGAAANWWWYVGDKPEMKKLVDILYNDYPMIPIADRQIIVYGEVYGGNVQKLSYGSPEKLCYVVFDILVNGKYLPWEEVITHCRACNVPTVPELYSGPYDFKTVAALADGKTVIGKDAHIREGVVVKTQGTASRQSYKYISDSYLLYKDGKADLDIHSE